MYQSIPSLTIPLGKTPGQFFDGRIPHPQQKEFKTPSPWACKKELNSTPRGIFLNYAL